MNTMTTLFFYAAMAVLFIALAALILYGTIAIVTTLIKAAKSQQKPTIDRENTNDPLRILREDCYTNDDINRMVGEMERRQYAENN